MARRNLLAEAQVTAAAQVAPQFQALDAALQQARADRDSAISAAATAYHGLSGAIHRAGPQVRKVYSGAQRSARGTDVIAKTQLGALASSPGVDVVKAAYAHEGAVGGTVIAKALASRLADLSDRRIASAAGRAFQVSKANSDYSAAAATNAEKRQGVAQQEGLLTGANFSKLTEAAAGRRNQRLMQERSLNSQANLQSERLASSERVADARLRSSEHTSALSRRQQKLGRIDRAKLQTQRLNAQARTQAHKTASGPKPTAATTFKGTQAIQAWVDQYKADGDMSTTADKARKQGIPSPIYNAAADIHSKGYISPAGVAALGRMGIAIPKAWTGVQVKPHTRKRRGQ